jgi:hypothetical protein
MPTSRTIRRNKKEFARGILLKRTIQPIPKEKNKHWTISVQEHNAKKAGKHLDLRLVDPRTGFAHSWAIPKARFPAQEDHPVLAIQTPTHTAEYALQFGANKLQTIGKGYGSGTVRIIEKDPVKIITAKPNSIKFEKRTGETYYLYRTKDTTWLLKKEAAMSDAFDIGYNLTLEKLAVRKQMGMEGSPSTSEMRKPLENQDQGSPADSLATMLQEIPELHTKNRAKSTDLGIQQRLNRRTGWSGPHSMQGERIEGASPVMVGRW